MVLPCPLYVCVCHAAAGEQVGITPGAAWRAAMEAATEVGSQQVLLGE